MFNRNEVALRIFCSLIADANSLAEAEVERMLITSYKLADAFTKFNPTAAGL